MVIAVTETANKTCDEKERNSPSTLDGRIFLMWKHKVHQTAHLLMYIHLHTDTHITFRLMDVNTHKYIHIFIHT